MKAEVVQYTDNEGREYYVEHLETIIKVSEIDASERYKMACEPCKKYGKNLACPPFSPVLSEYIEDSKTAKIICYRIPLEQFSGTVTEDRYRSAYRMARRILTDQLLHFRKKGYIVSGSGACLVCERCAVESGKTRCKHPAQKIYSLESMGVNVVCLTEKAFDLKLEWSGCDAAADFISAVGAVFCK